MVVLKKLIELYKKANVDPKTIWGDYKINKGIFVIYLFIILFFLVVLSFQYGYEQNPYYVCEGSLPYCEFEDGTVLMNGETAGTPPPENFCLFYWFVFGGLALCFLINHIMNKVKK